MFMGIRTRYAITAALLLFAGSVPANAQTGIDAQENVFGATNINAVVGHGGLTAGISRDGDVTVLSWPSPSYNDQLAYRSSHALDARSQPRFGALEGAGLFLGLRCDLTGGGTKITWLRGPQEDDAAAHTQTLHGAITVFGALDIAARAARRLGHHTQAKRWEDRALELRRAIEANFYDPVDQVFFMSESGRLPILASGLTPTGPTAWLVWPCTLVPFEDDRIQRQLQRDYGIIEPVLNLNGKGGSTT
jgi:hypothetical protein